MEINGAVSVIFHIAISIFVCCGIYDFILFISDLFIESEQLDYFFKVVVLAVLGIGLWRYEK